MTSETNSIRLSFGTGSQWLDAWFRTRTIKIEIGDKLVVTGLWIQGRMPDQPDVMRVVGINRIEFDNGLVKTDLVLETSNPTGCVNWAIHVLFRKFGFSGKVPTFRLQSDFPASGASELPANYRKFGLSPIFR